MPPIDQMKLSRRERQIMDVLIERGEVSAAEVREAIPDAPSYSAVRALIARLLDKGVIEFRLEGTKHIYSTKLEQGKVQQSALKRLLKTFFRGSRVNAVNALLDMEGESMSDAELKELERTISRIKKIKARDDL